MTNTEILQAYLWNISLYSHKPEDQTVHNELTRQARKYIGLDIPNIRESIHYQDVLELILMDVHGRFNACDWYGVEKNLRLFDRIASGKKVMGISFLIDGILLLIPISVEDCWIEPWKRLFKRSLMPKGIFLGIKCCYCEVR